MSVEVSGNGQTAQETAPEAEDWAVCCSGGGIRSAAYCLGALQSLDQIGLLSNVKWILGVSGGSYIASSRALVASQLDPGATPHAYAPGTPEVKSESLAGPSLLPMPERSSLCYLQIVCA